MRLTKLEIRRTEAYANPSEQLVGLVEVTGETGQQRITLSPGAICRLIAAVSDEVTLVAKANAKQVPNALESAGHECLLIEGDGKL